MQLRNIYCVIACFSDLRWPRPAVAAGRARASIQGLADLVPKTALVERNGKTASKLAIGDIILVGPGDRISADGDITEGTSEIDEAPVTGESTPKRKNAGDAVFAGTINTDGVLRIRATATADDNTIARVVRLVEEAQESKSRCSDDEYWLRGKW
jgi:Zn2+/Cd2+-exporting ATPase